MQENNNCNTKHRYFIDGKYILSGSQILSICWSAETELLVGLRANSLVVWCCPKAATQPDWLTITTVNKEISDLGRNPTLVCVEEGVARVCRGNGSILHVSVAVFPEKLLKHVAANMWQPALQLKFWHQKKQNPQPIQHLYSIFLQLCRTVEDETLWACLAVLAWQQRQLEVAEEAFALIHQYHQVCYIQHLRNNIPEKITKNET
ncbi:unnamed protein product [Diatraea saccharalis]|uniref:Uncharacterized protein n=1 Tax=Diatraea saccharalis TaxID=40085 RepID=A0A9N9QVD6_9NEOP|nr:unnamed protein product [Diatraea saccharalis]